MTTYYVSSGVLQQGQVAAGDTEVVLSGGTFQATRYNDPSVLSSIAGTVVLSNGGTLSGGMVISGGAVSAASAGHLAGNIQVSSGGSVSGGYADSLTVNSGGIVSGTSVSSGGYIDLKIGASASTLDIKSGGWANLSSGVHLGGSTIEAGGTIYVVSGGYFYGGNNIYGTATATGSGSVLNGYVMSGGVEIAQNGAEIYWNTVNAGGTAIVSSGGLLYLGGVNSGGTAIVSSGGTVSNYNVYSGGNLNVISGGVISGSVYLSGTASATIPATAGGTIVLNGDATTLTISGTSNPSTVISGFTGSSSTASDVIKLANIQKANVTSVTYPDADHVTITSKDGTSITLNILGVKSLGYTLAADTSGALLYEVCFLENAQIATPTGSKAIQDIVLGDEVVTYHDGSAKTDTVCWAGKASCVVRTDLPDDEAGYPVVISKNALADGHPYEDLRITAEHCLFFDGRFIPARMLVNGMSIYYDKNCTAYEYFHIETREHSIVNANGILTESYLDTGNRHHFTQQGNVFQLGSNDKKWSENGAATLTTDRDKVEPIFNALKNRAVSMNIQTRTAPLDVEHEHNISLISNTGLSILPARSSNGRYIFMVPSTVQSVRIVTNASRPYDTIGPFIDDRRLLGVLIGDITLYHSNVTAHISTHLQEVDLPGWHALEGKDYRWTNGDATLDLPAHEREEIGILAIHVKSSVPYLKHSTPPTIANQTKSA
ncbi:outer membrane protein [Neokomagataea thailandica NBRC 106555]|uniref:Hedgehog/Intein (Hint) domain-containing protein n=2 Tax=Neokomagataea TaxID=1223423 RepID=A0A4Y6V8Q3_9PROT|nr:MULTISPECIES: Hint domain-containing protein [Neokomagataea]QDH25050.1 hypothetical protein D5366_07325 [Neokomagataea tanensis]GBR51368.1 outer membrane protein [Neokomagataea thailandica NBRC 106555]